MDDPREEIIKALKEPEFELSGLLNGFLSIFLATAVMRTLESQFPLISKEN